MRGGWHQSPSIPTQGRSRTYEYNGWTGFNVGISRIWGWSAQVQESNHGSTDASPVADQHGVTTDGSRIKPLTLSPASQRKNQ